MPSDDGVGGGRRGEAEEEEEEEGGWGEQGAVGGGAVAMCQVSQWVGDTWGIIDPAILAIRAPALRQLGANPQLGHALIV